MINQKLINKIESPIKSINDPSDIATVVSHAVELAKLGSQIQMAQQPDLRFESSYSFNPTSISALSV